MDPKKLINKLRSLAAMEEYISLSKSPNAIGVKAERVLEHMETWLAQLRQELMEHLDRACEACDDVRDLEQQLARLEAEADVRDLEDEEYDDDDDDGGADDEYDDDEYDDDDHGYKTCRQRRARRGDDDDDAN